MCQLLSVSKHLPTAWRDIDIQQQIYQPQSVNWFQWNWSGTWDDMHELHVLCQLHWQHHHHGPWRVCYRCLCQAWHGVSVGVSCTCSPQFHTQSKASIRPLDLKSVMYRMSAILSVSLDKTTTLSHPLSTLQAMWKIILQSASSWLFFYSILITFIALIFQMMKF
jgi:hypothetical protein